MIIRLYRYLRGTVLFRCEGAMCERFLNLATAADIKLFDLEKQGLSLTARVRAEAVSYTHLDVYKRQD